MVLGAFPDEDESVAKLAWLTFVTLGEPERSFVEFADQMWAYVTARARTRPSRSPRPACDPASWSTSSSRRCSRPRRGGRGATRCGSPTRRARPRANRAPRSTPEAARIGQDAKDGQGRQSPEGQGHGPGRDRSKPVEVTADARPERRGAGREAPRRRPPALRQGRVRRSMRSSSRSRRRPVEARAPAPEASRRRRSRRSRRSCSASAVRTGDDEETEVDRVLLAKEFSGLLQLDSDDDEGSS